MLSVIVLILKANSQTKRNFYDLRRFFRLLEPCFSSSSSGGPRPLPFTVRAPLVLVVLLERCSSEAIRRVLARKLGHTWRPRPHFELMRPFLFLFLFFLWRSDPPERLDRCRSCVAAKWHRHWVALFHAASLSLSLDSSMERFSHTHTTTTVMARHESIVGLSLSLSFALSICFLFHSLPFARRAPINRSSIDRGPRLLSAFMASEARLVLSPFLFFSRLEICKTKRWTKRKKTSPLPMGLRRGSWNALETPVFDRIIVLKYVDRRLRTVLFFRCVNKIVFVLSNFHHLKNALTEKSWPNVFKCTFSLGSCFFGPSVPNCCDDDYVESAYWRFFAHFRLFLLIWKSTRRIFWPVETTWCLLLLLLLYHPTIDICGLFFFACLANLFLFVFYLRKINRAASLCVVLCVFFFDFPHTAMTISPTLFLSNGHRAMYVAGRSPFFFSSSSFFCSPTRENHLIWSVTTRWPTHRLRLCRKNKKRQQYGQAVEAFFFTTSNRIRQQFADLGRTWMALIRLRIH